MSWIVGKCLLFWWVMQSNEPSCPHLAWAFFLCIVKTFFFLNDLQKIVLAPILLLFRSQNFWFPWMALRNFSFNAVFRGKYIFLYVIQFIHSESFKRSWAIQINAFFKCVWTLNQWSKFPLLFKKTNSLQT